MTRLWSVLGLIGFFLAFLPMCGGAGSAVRPQAKSAADALDEKSCAQVEDHGTPLIADWRDDRRAVMEVAMKQSVAVVSYSCKSIQILPDCHAAGDYAFAGVTGKERVVTLKNADEIAANLPATGATIGARVAASSDISIDTFLVGIRRTARLQVQRGELVGECAGATHFVRGAYIGAFAMGTTTKGSVEAAGSLFKVGANAKSGSARDEANTDGDIDECKKATPDDPSPRNGCGAAFRLELTRISEPAAAPLTADESSVCRPGFVLSSGTCVVVGTSAPHACQKGDLAECDQQCKAGDAPSCGTLAAMLIEGYNAKEDMQRGTALLNQACAMGDASSCATIGALYLSMQDFGQAAKYLKPACDAGDGGACNDLGVMLILGKGFAKAPAAGVALLTRGCDAGDADACFRAGVAHKPGETAPDPALALRFFERACTAKKTSEACPEAARLLLTKDEARAIKILDAACNATTRSACELLGYFYKTGQHVAASNEKADAYYDIACDLIDGPACVATGQIALAARDFGRADRDFNRACEQKEKAGCAGAAALEKTCPPPLAHSADGKCGLPVTSCDGRDSNACITACNRGDNVSCTMVGVMARDGKGGFARNPALAERMFRRACVIDPPGLQHACSLLALTEQYTDPGTAVLHVQKSCAANDPLGCATLGYFNTRGIGLPVDVAKGLSLTLRACEGGDPSGCSESSWVYGGAGGRLREVNRPKAILYGERACKLGWSADCSWVGAAFEVGNGVAVDLPRAAESFRLGCDAGVVLSCANLSGMLYDGRGVQQDSFAGVRLAGQTCTQGSGYGCLVMALAHHFGRGAAVDEQRAHSFAARACSIDQPKACNWAKGQWPN